ncbi:Set1 complex component spp1 [Lecanosticta acicola]|uniref:Set1 complex component spp1 n=1 Tax=Lecanosticta acicola TaxID=111012 RepID=A0AAI8YUF5_9PEZI|nr:Set1 complex component spp1 [Lecanosticta acicola]
MSLSLSSLLNPSPDAETRSSPSLDARKNSLPPIQHVESHEEHPARSPSSVNANQQHFAYPSSTRNEAAQALASLSTSPAPPPSQWNGHSAQDASQLERTQSCERRQSQQLPLPQVGSSRKMNSPTLDQYHVASRSPEQRRQSVVSPLQSDVTLPPIQGLAPSPSDQLDRVNQPDSSAQSVSQAQSHAREAQNSSHVSKTHTSSISTLREEGGPAPETIKQEATATPQPAFPTEARRPPDMDNHTFKAVASLKNEHGLRIQSPLRELSVPVPTTEVAAPEPQTANAKKRPAPSKTKKGTASTVKKEKAPPAKKRKVEPKRSATPSSRASKMSTIKGASAKGTPIDSSPAPSTRSYSAEPNEEPYDDEDEDMDEDGDGDEYCICRKPDTGTFMIGCDGTCDDWFHGKCVGIEERDKNLIDKYLCPNCTKAGVGQTTWKRMCRRAGCRQPAKAGKIKSGIHASKYCSEECGVQYFREMVSKTRGREEHAKSRGSRRKGSIAESERTPADDDLGAKGGVLSAGEVKALLSASNTAEDFRKLGDGVLSPPATPDGKERKVEFTEYESQALDRIQQAKEDARRRHALLKDRMKFVTLAKQAASRTATEKELKPKEYCGYDPRLEWTEIQFEAWRNSTAGRQAFEQETLKTEKSDEKKEIAKGAEQPEICDRKKCARHLEWSKLAVDDVRHEMGDNSDRMRALDKEEKDIRERAALRTKAGKSSDEGSVEVHGLGITTAENDKMVIDLPLPRQTAEDAAESKEPSTAILDAK